MGEKTKVSQIFPKGKCKVFLFQKFRNSENFASLGGLSVWQLAAKLGVVGGNLGTVRWTQHLSRLYELVVMQLNRVLMKKEIYNILFL